MTSFTSATTSFGLRTGLISLSLLGCGTEPPCVENERTIAQGVYGQVAYLNNDQSLTPLYDVKLSVMGTEMAAYADVTSNKSGFYELALPANRSQYAICSSFANAGCWSFQLSGLERLDLIVFSGEIAWDSGIDDATCP